MSVENKVFDLWKKNVLSNIKTYKTLGEYVFDGC